MEAPSDTPLKRGERAVRKDCARKKAREPDVLVTEGLVGIGHLLAVEKQMLLLRLNALFACREENVRRENGVTEETAAFLPEISALRSATLASGELFTRRGEFGNNRETAKNKRTCQTPTWTCRSTSTP